MKTIGDYVQMLLFGGQIMQRVLAKEDDDYEEYKVLIPKIMEEGIINTDEAPVEKVKKNIDKKFLTQEGDLVIKLSSPYDCCYITKEYENMIVPSFCAIVRNYEGLFDKFYLLAYFNSRRFKHYIDIETSGLTMRLLSPGIIKRISIPEA